MPAAQAATIAVGTPTHRRGRPGEPARRGDCRGHPVSPPDGERVVLATVPIVAAQPADVEIYPWGSVLVSAHELRVARSELLPRRAHLRRRVVEGAVGPDHPVGHACLVL